MSRKAREDKASWLVPSIYVFAGDYGPFKPPRNFGAIENALVLLTSTFKDDAAADEDGGKKSKDSDQHVRRHPMYEYAMQAQNILLQENYQKPNSNFRHMIIVDVADMVAGNDDNPGDALSDMMRKEIDSREPIKGFGKTLLRLFQRMNIQNVTLAAEGEMCCILLKLYDALGADKNIVARDIWLLHPVLPAHFVNTMLVPMGGSGKRRPPPANTKNGKQGVHSKPPTLQVNLVFQDDKSRDKRLGMIRHVFPDGTTDVIPRQAVKWDILRSIFGNNGTESDGDDLVYNPDYCNELGKSLFLSTLTVEMNRHSKQYERTSEEITADLLKVEHLSKKGENGINTALELTSIDWSRCERHIGALVLRGNRCVLVRSLTGQWEGMRFPSVVAKEGESSISAAIRSVVEFTGGVEEAEVRALEMISPITVYAPNGRNIVVQLFPMYATAPPPDGPLEDADMEDDETSYDWYLYENAVKRLDERSVAALRSISLILVEAANVGILPCKWGGVFGQELAVPDASVVDKSTTGHLAVQAEQWKPSRQADVLQDVRKANADILSNISSNRKDGQPYKLLCTILSGFLGAGKTTLLSHILANYSGLKVAILVNDMGEINIDAALLTKHSISVTQKEEHLVEMSNGCICCTLREDLLVEVAKIASQGTFDYLIIESTGISEPLPVAETFTFEDSTGLRLGDIAQIDTLVTVVDGSKFLTELDSIQSLKEREWHADPQDQRTISHLLCDQVEFANVLVLNKCDLMNADEKNKVKRVIAHMNPTAQVIESVHSVVPLDSVLGTGLFSMSEAEKNDGWLKEARIGEHLPETLEYDISSFTYRSRKPFLPHKLHCAIESMLNQTAPFDESIILRSKGFIWLASFSSIQGDFSLAGQHFSLVPGNPWWAEIDKEHWPAGLEAALEPLWNEPFGDRQQEIVIIGMHLNKEEIITALDDCLLADEDMDKGQDVWNQKCADAGDPFYEDWHTAIQSMANDVENGHSHDHSHNDSHDHHHDHHHN